MVAQTLDELRPYGIPSACQGFIEWKPEGLKYPFIGFFDYHWQQHNITTDLKTTERMPSAVKVGHARQVALYVTSNNADARVTYCTPKKCQTYSVDNIDAHRDALYRIALKIETFLARSEDPKFFKSITVPDLESYFWSNPVARQLAWEHFGI